MDHQDGTGWDLTDVTLASMFLPFSHEVVKRACTTRRTFFPGVWKPKILSPGYRILFVSRKEGTTERQISNTCLHSKPSPVESSCVCLVLSPVGTGSEAKVRYPRPCYGRQATAFPE